MNEKNGDTWVFQQRVSTADLAAHEYTGSDSETQFDQNLGVN